MKSPFPPTPKYLVSIGPALIAAGTAVMSMLANKRSSDVAYSRQRRLMDYQNQLNQENWMMQNEYNTPLNQRSRLLEAGINPAMTAGDASSIADGISPVGQATATGPDYQSAINSGLAASQIQSDIDKKVAETSYTRALDAYQRGITKGEIDYLGQKIRYQKALTELTEEEKKKVSAEIAETESNTKKVLQEIKNLQGTLEIQQQENFRQQALFQLEKAYKQKELNAFEVRLAYELLREQAGINLLNAQTAESVSRTNLNESQELLNDTISALNDEQLRRDINQNNADIPWMDSNAQERAQHNWLQTVIYGQDAGIPQHSFNGPHKVEQYLRGLYRIAPSVSVKF